jgi:hypothetical protein
MQCGFCAKELPEELPEAACGACLGGCRKIHCPWCGYANPAPSKLLKKMMKKIDDKEGES